MAIRNMDEARRLMNEHKANGTLDQMKPDWDFAKNYGVKELEALGEVTPATAMMAAVLLLTGVIGCTTASHGRDVQDFVLEETIKMLRKEVASLRDYMAQTIPSQDPAN